MSNEALPRKGVIEELDLSRRDGSECAIVLCAFWYLRLLRG